MKVDPMFIVHMLLNDSNNYVTIRSYTLSVIKVIVSVIDCSYMYIYLLAVNIPQLVVVGITMCEW